MSRPQIAILCLSAAMIGMVAYQIVRPAAPLPAEEIDPATLELIDFTRLPEPIAEFIELARRNQAVGRPLSDFPDLWAESLPGDPRDHIRFQWRKFLLPETPELQNANRSMIDSKSGPLYSLTLMIRVDTEESRIVRVVVYTQGF